MCTERTIQKHLLLKALDVCGGVSVLNQIVETMKSESVTRYGTPERAVYPETVDALLQKCLDNGFVVKSSPISIQLTEDGRSAMSFMEKKFLAEPAIQ